MSPFLCQEKCDEIDSFAPAHLTLRADLRSVYLALPKGSVVPISSPFLCQEKCDEIVTCQTRGDFVKSFPVKPVFLIFAWAVLTASTLYSTEISALEAKAKQGSCERSRQETCEKACRQIIESRQEAAKKTIPKAG